MSLYEIFYCRTCFERYYIHPQEPATLFRFIFLFRGVLVYWCGSSKLGCYRNASWWTTSSKLLSITCWIIVQSLRHVALHCMCDLYNCSFGLAFFVYRNLISCLILQLVAAISVL